MYHIYRQKADGEVVEFLAFETVEMAVKVLAAQAQSNGWLFKDDKDQIAGGIWETPTGDHYGIHERC